ncbi:unnamed protein product [Adineta ricciae]|uniref:Uncharacterized protein n=1 Tax=Adineta ricciae TaxID=249248 RepID=A0A813P3F6_ADIRI|nr:unnamed protein product [Adineta ricciae]CAF0931297.1 unnamed protein product [Adineta ricciae]
MLHVISFVIFTFLVSCTVGQLPRIQVDPATQHFVDEYGRVRIFHGVNVVYKLPPFLPNLTHFDPQKSLTEDDLTNLHQWGFNVVRFYTAWMGVNPTSEAEINQQYLSQLSKSVQMMEDKGIYALLDCHQDVLSRYFCGEGVPDWVAQKLGNSTLYGFPFPLATNITREPDTGYPTLDACLKRPFFQYYLTEAVMTTFKMIYTNEQGVLDSFASFWRTIASTFANRSSVLGYELLNEPSFSKLIDAVRIGQVDRTYLAPMYKKLHETIRQVDDKRIIFYEPCVADLLQTGLEQGPGGVKYNDRQAFSYHIYCIDVTKQGDPKSDLVCDVDDVFAISSRYEEAKKKKFGGMMLTEFGAISNSTEGVTEITRITGIADDYLQSWSYWQFKKYEDLTTAASPATTESFYTEDGKLEVNKVRALSRSYAQAIAGLPVSMMFDPKTAVFQLTFIINTDIHQPTVVYINEDLNYPQGNNIDVSPASSLTWTSPTRNYYEFLPATSTKNGTSIVIKIVPKTFNWYDRLQIWIQKQIALVRSFVVYLRQVD